MSQTAIDAPVTRQHYVLVFFISYLLWLLLVGTLARDELLLGALVSLAVTLLFAHRFTIFTGFRFTWKAPLYI